MSYKNFDKLLGEKLRTYDEQPSVDVFSRIEKSLADAPVPTPIPVPKPKRSMLYRISGYSAIAAAIILGIFVFLRRGEQMQNTPEYAVENILKKTGASTVDVPKLLADNQQRAADSDGRLAGSKNIVEIIRDVIAEDNNALAEWQAPDDVESESIPTAPSTVAEARKEPSIKQSAAATEMKSFVQASAETNAKRKQFERERNIENYWADVFGEDLRLNGRPTGKKRGMGISLYAGNFGVGTGDMVYKDQPALMDNNMFVSESSVSIPGKSVSENGPMRAPEIPQINDVSLTHSMPLNFGISVTYPLTDRLSLASGVNYSYLYSYARQSSRNGDIKTMQELHYVGIPVGVIYSFYSGRLVDFYIRGGCQLEKAVSAVKKFEYESAQSNADQGGKMGVKGFQPSVDAAAGTNIKFTKGVGLYIEPGVAYYFERADQPRSYRTENPTNFTVRIGVRFDL